MRIAATTTATLNQPRRPRRAALAVELLLILPILLLFVLAMLQFGLTIYARQQLSGASREAARVAATGGDEQKVAEAVQHYLGNGRLSQACVRITDADGNPVRPQDLNTGDTVEVWVEIKTICVVPDLLRFVGYSHQNQCLVGRTAMRKE